MDEISWIEVSLKVTPEQAEAVADVLGRFTPEGVVIEQLIAQTEDSTLSTLENSVRVFGYLFADSSFETKKQRLEEALFYLGRIQPLAPAVYSPIADQDWMEAWKQHYKPLKIGKKLIILPAWVENSEPERLPIRINPGMAFGTGTHPSTQLCLLLMEDLVKPGIHFFDVGCGSGILSIAAILLGASSAAAVDISPASVRSSQENAGLNGIKERIQIMQGSIERFQNGIFDDLHAPLVAANILAPVIISLFEDGLADLVQPGGNLLLSGILNTQADDVINTAKSCGLVHVETKTMQDWCGIHVTRPA